jgi:hypothetical protein
MKKPHWIFLILSAGLAAGWLGYGLAGEKIAGLVAAHLGKILLRVGQGKFTDPAWFVRYRMLEALWLASVALALAVVHWGFNAWLKRRWPAANWRGIANGLLGFVTLNVWVGAALNTALFWAVLGLGGGVQNLMQFHFKRILLEENRTPVRAVLMGNSQTRAEIKEEILNAELGTNFWATELHFPGSHGYDVLLLEDEIQKANPEMVICYLTEGYFYAGSHGETPANFLSWSDLPELWRLGGLPYFSWNEMFSSLFGDVCPIFHCRQVLAQRLFGNTAAQLKQVAYDTALNPDLKKRAEEHKSGLQLNTESDFQKRAFETFVAQCAAAGRQVVLLEGGFNPLYEQEIDPAIRKDMHTYLAGLQQRHANVVLFPATALPRQTPADYVDLDHVNEDMQKRFSEWLAGTLRPLVEQAAAAAAAGKK